MYHYVIMPAIVKTTSGLVLVLIALSVWGFPGHAASLPEDMHSGDEQSADKDVDNRSLPPEIREDVEKPSSGKPLPGEADADDETPEAPAASPKPELAPDAPPVPPSPSPAASPKPKQPKKKKPRAKKDAPASPSPSSSPSPSASPAAKAKKQKKQKKPKLEVTASPSPGASPKPEQASKHDSAKSEGGKKKKGDFTRTGEEASIAASAADRGAVAAVTQAAPYLDPLKAVLNGLIEAARNPMERDLSLGYLGYIGDRARLPAMLARIDDPKVDDSERLPVLAALVDGYDDRSKLPVLQRIADDPKCPIYQKLWALETLAQAGDKSRLPLAQKLVDDKDTDANDRMRALDVCARLSDDSRSGVLKKIGHDADLFQATRMAALGCLARMEHATGKDAGEGIAELRKAMQKSKLSVEERLSISADLCQINDASVRDFLERVVEREADSIFDQLRALHGLALLGSSEHLGLLQEAIRTKNRSRNTARRILVLMGDRSHVADLLDDARTGDLEAVRTLVLAAVMDQQKMSTPDLMKKARYKALIAP